jgi:murein DD-endopeptidase MepM/ murein hydrolase activator NlpD
MTEDSSSTPNPIPEVEESGASAPQESPKPGRRWNEIWESLVRMGLGEIAVRVGTGVASIALILLVVWVMGSFYLKGRVTNQREAAIAASLPTTTPTIIQPDFQIPQDYAYALGIPRLAQIHTSRPDQSRFEITTYTVQEGDTVIGIAKKFGLKPQTLLFGNLETLADDPHRLTIGQKLNILPIDGALYRWHAGDGLNGVAKFFNVSVDDIINWPSNKLDRARLGDLSKPNIEPDTQIFIPGGTRAFTSWSAPVISRTDPAKAKIFGAGYCGEQYSGYIGTGTFIWPSTEHWLSGFDFSPEINHWGIDEAGRLGNPIYAADSGVVVYAGWNDWGYGNVIVIDHGNGWQTLYGHLSELYVGCGASVSQGATIAAMGSTGRSTGPHLHFEIMSTSGVRVNPHSFLPPN